MTSFTHNTILAEDVTVAQAHVETQIAMIDEAGIVAAETADIKAAEIVHAEMAMVDNSQHDHYHDESTFEDHSVTVPTVIIEQPEGPFAGLGRFWRNLGAAVAIIGVPVLFMQNKQNATETQNLITKTANEAKARDSVNQANNNANVAHIDSAFAAQKNEIQAGTNEMHRQVHNHAEELKKAFKEQNAAEKEQAAANALLSNGQGMSPGAIIAFPSSLKRN